MHLDHKKYNREGVNSDQTNLTFPSFFFVNANLLTHISILQVFHLDFLKFVFFKIQVGIYNQFNMGILGMYIDRNKILEVLAKLDEVIYLLSIICIA